MKICILHVCNHLNSGSSLTRIYILDQNQFKNKKIKKRRVHKITPQRRIQNNQIKISEKWPCELI